MRAEAAKKGISGERRKFWEYYFLKRKAESNYWIEMALKLLNNSSRGIAVINGMRMRNELDYLEKHCGSLLLIALDAEQNLRAQRVILRRRKGDPQSTKEFQEQEVEYWRIFQVDELMKRSHIQIDNSGSLGDLMETVGRALNGRL